MTAIGLAKGIYGAFNNEKPHSSITQWVDILTSDRYGGEAYEGIPELVDSIKLQATGPTEASRAVRKKLKHGDTHQQYRGMVILSALVENCGPRFQSSFADSQLTDAIKNLATGASTDAGVKKKTLQVLRGWQDQFKDDPGMQYVAKLYKNVAPPAAPKGPDPAALAEQRRRKETEEELSLRAVELEKREQRINNQQEAKDEAYARDLDRQERAGLAKAKIDKARRDEEARKRDVEARKRDEEVRKREEEARKAAAKNKSKAKPVPKRKWDYEKEKPLILTSIAAASQASSNLVNSITLVNTENDSLPKNARVQECLEAAKESRKKIVRYIQLVENEELMGTLIETNERIITSMEMYDTLTKPVVTEKDVDNVQKNIERVHIQSSELGKLQDKQRAAVQRAVVRQNSGQPRRERSLSPPRLAPRAGKGRAHPDLNDLDLKGSELPQPIRPAPHGVQSSDEEPDHRGSLSDYSDYESSSEEETDRAGGSRSQYRSGWESGSRSASKARAYAGLSDEDEPKKPAGKKLVDDEDPFADPFVDQ